VYKTSWHCEAVKLAHITSLGPMKLIEIRTLSISDPPRKEEYRPAPGPDTSLLGGQDMEGLEPEEEEQEFEFAEDLVRYIDREWKGWFCVGVAGTSRDPSL
jgi:hypothetical protein